MSTKQPRIQVSLDPDDFEIIKILSRQRKQSASSIINRLVHESLEEYEDYLLLRQAEEAEKRWIESGRPTISHEELWKELGI